MYSDIYGPLGKTRCILDKTNHSKTRCIYIVQSALPSGGLHGSMWCRTNGPLGAVQMSDTNKPDYNKANLRDLKAATGL